MKTPFYLIDTFTSTKFKGNPTSVCYLNDCINKELMLSIAQEVGVPVTAFVLPLNANTYGIRYFTITGEIPACGHATLASAEVMFKRTKNNDEISFKTIEEVIIDCNKKENIIYMTYPKYEMIDYNVSNKTLDTLGIKNYSSIGFCKELETLFIEIDNAKILREIKPNYNLLKESNNEIKEVVITSISDIKEYDFLLRSFCPWIGINEDPVTGSVHSVLARFWETKLNKISLVAYQASKRGGEVYVTSSETKIELGGKSIMVLEGRLNI